MAKTVEELPFKYAWKTLFLGEHGPKNHVTVLVLMMLAEHMKPDGSNCWPSQTYLAKRTRLSDRTVRTHVALAVAAGWLSVRPRKRAKGRSWFVNEYTPLIPDSAKATVWIKPGIRVPKWMRQANVAGDHLEARSRSSDLHEEVSHSRSSIPPKEAPITRNSIPEHSEAGSGVTRNIVPTNSSILNLSFNPTDTGLPKSGFTGCGFGKVKTGQESMPESDAEMRKRIVIARTMCPDDASASPETLGRLTGYSPDTVRRLLRQ